MVENYMDSNFLLNVCSIYNVIKERKIVHINIA